MWIARQYQQWLIVVAIWHVDSTIASVVTDGRGIMVCG